MESFIIVDKGTFWFEFGWFRGSEFHLLGIDLFEVTDSLITIFKIQIFRFIIAFGFNI